MSMGGYGYTKERGQSSNFSESYFFDNVAYTVNGDSNSYGIFGNLRDSIGRTFVEQNRWNLFTKGMLITLLITVFTVIICSLTGFILFLASHRRKWLTNIPSIRSAIVATLKSTAIVGYVAVQDLTKAGDIIRSQTFEAFVPIVSVAILYYVLAKILIFLLNKLLITPSERRRTRR